MILWPLILFYSVVIRTSQAVHDNQVIVMHFEPMAIDVPSDMIYFQIV